jgi:GalNAc-alpha-(1->4)-GalNAc-alpha-(1->3)-diNAcBac-PP-undecaprenol alpha-1,4-N-acetyl-D-galactosaminyltransferase
LVHPCREKLIPGFTAFQLNSFFKPRTQQQSSLELQNEPSTMPKNITLFVNQLFDGGAARVAVYLTHAWADMGRNVTILTTDGGLNPPFYALHPNVVHVPLGIREDSHHFLAAMSNNFKRLVKVRRAIRASRPDLLVSFIDSNNILCLLATRSLPTIPTIVSERTDPHGRPLGRAWDFLRNLTYPWADGLVTQSQHALGYFSARVQTRGRVIPNPVFRPPAASPSSGRPARPRVISLGRLDRVKGHDQLVDAFALIARDFPEWDLRIHGDGPERDALVAQIISHGLEGQISILPKIADVGTCLRDSDLFVLPSRTEGFPNALAEAMAWGLPVISFDCESGPSELIRQDQDGLLVPPGDVLALAQSMARLMSDPAERAGLGARATEVLTRFSPGRVMGLWESAIESATLNAQGRKQP